MKSIIQNEKECFFCGQTACLQDHHIFFGEKNRKHSEKYGLKVWLCVEHHTGKESVHRSAAMDKVLTATQADAAALAAAKEAGQEEALSYYETIDLDLYSDDAVAEISGYVAAAIAAIESATTADEVNAAVAQLKTNVGGVAKLAGANEGKSSGCGSVVTGGLAALLAVGVAMVFKKKED